MPYTSIVDLAKQEFVDIYKVQASLGAEDNLYIDIDETELSLLQESLAKQGLKVRKVLSNGKFIVERLDKQYDLTGKEVR